MTKQVICEIFCLLSIVKGQCQWLASSKVQLLPSLRNQPLLPTLCLITVPAPPFRFLHTTNQALPPVQHNTETELIHCFLNKYRGTNVCLSSRLKRVVKNFFDQVV